MRLASITAILVATGILFSSLMPVHRAAPSPAVEQAIEYFRGESVAFSENCNALSKALQNMDPQNALSVQAARSALAAARAHYKRIESFMEYFFLTSARIYNSPPKFEGEEPAMEYQPPMGLQVIEDGLFQKPEELTALRNDLLQQASAIAGSAADIPAMLYQFDASEAQLFESLRLELVRVIALGITGFDAPLLKSGIVESREALYSLQRQIQPFFNTPSPHGDSTARALAETIDYLGKHPDFDSFDRLYFLTHLALPLQRQLGLFIREKGSVINTASALNYDAEHLYSRNVFNMERFPNGVNQPDSVLIAKGRMLFFDPSLSGNGQRSCVSCHNPGKAFTDGLVTAATVDGNGRLDRNTPTLVYSALQHAQFWDGKVTSLENQIRTVLASPREMNADTSRLAMGSIVPAIAAYLRTLVPLNSAFDRFMNGDSTALDKRQIRGANLFMGRAQCATCHFAPVFNGLIPPYYKVTEFEVLGTTATDRLNKPVIGKDSGRYSLYPLEFYVRAFKTPTVRNAALTAPYMHNGAFGNLETLMDFYNRGGGSGLGLNVPTQTLSARPLHLSHRDMADIILFMNSLSDNMDSVKK